MKIATRGVKINTASKTEMVDLLQNQGYVYMMQVNDDHGVLCEIWARFERETNSISAVNLYETSEEIPSFAIVTETSVRTVES